MSVSTDWTALAVTHTPEGDTDVVLRGTGAGNVLGGAFWDEFPSLLGAVGTGGSLVIRGAGHDFSAGLDLRWYLRRLTRANRAGTAEATMLDDTRRMQAALTALETGPRVSIALIDGTCIGVGLELALACDLRVATKSATFSLPEVSLGILPDIGGLHRLPRIAGDALARRMILTGASVGAEEALRHGLVTNVAESAGEAEAVVADLRSAVRDKPADVIIEARRHLLGPADPDAAARWNSERLGSGEFERRMSARLLEGAPS